MSSFKKIGRRFCSSPQSYRGVPSKWMDKFHIIFQGTFAFSVLTCVWSYSYRSFVVEEKSSWCAISAMSKSMMDKPVSAWDKAYSSKENVARNEKFSLSCYWRFLVGSVFFRDVSLMGKPDCVQTRVQMVQPRFASMSGLSFHSRSMHCHVHIYAWRQDQEVGRWGIKWTKKVFYITHL